MIEIEFEWAVYQCQDPKCRATWLGLSGDDSYGKRCESCGQKFTPEEIKSGTITAMVEERIKNAN